MEKPSLKKLDNPAEDTFKLQSLTSPQTQAQPTPLQPLPHQEDEESVDSQPLPTRAAANLDRFQAGIEQFSEDIVQTIDKKSCFREYKEKHQ